ACITVSDPVKPGTGRSVAGACRLPFAGGRDVSPPPVTFSVTFADHRGDDPGFSISTTAISGGSSEPRQDDSGTYTAKEAQDETDNLRGALWNALVDPNGAYPVAAA